MWRLALAGVGPAMLAEFTVRDDLRTGKLVAVLPGTLPVAHEPFHVVYVGRSGRLPARVRVFLDHLAAHGRVGRSSQAAGFAAGEVIPPRDGGRAPGTRTRA